MSQGRERLCGWSDPIGAECRLVGGDGTLYPDITDMQVISCDAGGLVCLNFDNGGACEDYEVRYMCAGKLPLLKCTQQSELICKKHRPFL